MKLLRDMTEPELLDYFSGLANLIENRLPPGPSRKGKCLFVLLVTDETGPRTAQYVSNARRGDIIQFLRETADRLEGREDIPR
jgi:hypothetical protein